MKQNEANSSRGGDFLTDKRAQTLQDFVFGISIFLLITTFVFGLFPGFLSPFTSGTEATDQAQADRVAESIVLNLSSEASNNQLDVKRLRNTLAKPSPELQKRYGLPAEADMNITVQKLDSREIVRWNGKRLATKKSFNNNTAASATRIVKMNDSSICNPGCRLIVRVW